jgi:hypothetical protein
MWTYFFMVVGILGIVLINIFSDLLIANEQDYFILKEATEAAMIDAVDYKAYREGLGYDGVTHDSNPDLIKMETEGLPTVRIREEKFVESFLMRFSKAAGMKKTYTVTIHDIDECPPKVSITITAKDKFSFLQFFRVNYDSDSLVVNKITAILEDPIPSVENN